MSDVLSMTNQSCHQITLSYSQSRKQTCQWSSQEATGKSFYFIVLSGCVIPPCVNPHIRWCIVNKEVFQSIGRPTQNAKIICAAGKLSDTHKNIWSSTETIEMLPHLKPMLCARVFFSFIFWSCWVKRGQCSEKDPNWLHALRTDCFAEGHTYVGEVLGVCACVSEFVCTHVRACDSSVGWVGWGTLVICWSHTVLSPPCPRLVHIEHTALITRLLGLRPGDRVAAANRCLYFELMSSYVAHCSMVDVKDNPWSKIDCNGMDFLFFRKMVQSVDVFADLKLKYSKSLSSSFLWTGKFQWVMKLSVF